ncbi:MAG: DUF1275 domain-containing protein [Xanthomonadaceae bacterium]|nr:DUF1275 domain-containing protein [Xanthomonadaceae bacterium]
MAEQLPTWVWIGAGTLASIAGMVNVIGYQGFEHQALTHLTGITSQLGIAIIGAQGKASWHLLGILAAFTFGAMLSGVIIQNSTLRLGRRYGVALTLESILLFASIPLFKQHQIYGALLAATACGLQNALATTYSGAAVRSSHLTGMFTDLGIGLGHTLRGMPIPKRRILLSVFIITGFFFGGIFGALLFRRLGYDALLIPAALTGLTGIGYTAFQQWIIRKSKNME